MLELTVSFQFSILIHYGKCRASWSKHEGANYMLCKQLVDKYLIVVTLLIYH